ncbi:unnamed protein product [Coffea canephora]|uniref:PUM-HD domain-containing protein n=1 Tax=Coffea canephora TaxID=49390 RepID=A0A068TN57_COFCA|nr:unnamed protein product [Coffea canephora]
MKDDEELELLLGEIPHAISFNHHHHLRHGHGSDHHHHNLDESLLAQKMTGMMYRMGMYDDVTLDHNNKHTCASPVSGFSLHSDGSSSSLFSGGHSFSDNGSPTTPPVEELQTHSNGGTSTQSHYSDRLWMENKSPDSYFGRKADDNVFDELRLLRNLSRMYVSKEPEDVKLLNLSGRQIFDRVSGGNIGMDLDQHGLFSQYYGRGISDSGRIQCPVPGSPLSLDANLLGSRYSLSQSVPHGSLEALSGEQSLIIQGESLNYALNRVQERSRHNKGSPYEADVNAHQEKQSLIDGCPQIAGNQVRAQSLRLCCPFSLPSKCNSLGEAQGYIYYIAKDQHGCRFLQRMFDEGTPQDVQVIFTEIIDHVVELMMNPFGNYLMQKLLEACNEEQRMQILLRVTAKPGELIRISLNTHGTRVVQKLIETLKSRQQTSLVISALEPGFLALIKDLNGNHVVQRCLQCLSYEDSKFIFVAAAKYCVDIATHQHGCCVLQRCISHASGEHRENLIAEISANGLLLAQDAFGNYVVQFILELKIPSATTKLVCQFEGNYVHLSTQKFSSHVVEKCLAVCSNEVRSTIIHELLSATHFEQLLQDPHANYVVQTALKVSEGPLHDSLVEAIESHKAISRNSPYSKRIFSHKLLKK